MRERNKLSDLECKFNVTRHTLVAELISKLNDISWIYQEMNYNPRVADSTRDKLLPYFSPRSTPSTFA